MLGIWWFIESLSCEMEVGAGLSVNAETFCCFTEQLFPLNVAKVLMLQNIFSLIREYNFQYYGLLTNSAFSDQFRYVKTARIR